MQQKKKPNRFLEVLLDTSDMLKGKKSGQWKQALPESSTFAETFQQFNVEAASSDSWNKLQIVIESDWYNNAYNFTGALPQAMWNWI